MTENNGNGDHVSRTFAAMLGDIEDLATELTQRHKTLAAELATVEAELERVETVRSAMLGTSAKSPAKRSSGSRGVKGAEALERANRLRQQFQGNEFTAREAADVLGVKTQGIGPIMVGIVNRGEATMREDDGGQRIYTFVPA